VHSLKGLVKNFHATAALEEAIEQLEGHARLGNLPAAAAAWDGVRGHVAILLGGLKTFVAGECP
jgi:hypothetical protein